ncbi:MAG: hypothetical protein WA943_02110 [Parvibaculum sp.]|uniref:hypothetical protein n=1 Tax=Parvibaculum sp. TaxID=2024848 RepID=UPI003C7587A6
MIDISPLMNGAEPVQRGRDAGSSGDEDAASYLFELLVAARRLAVMRRHKFLAYLIGMAAEEARLLTQGRSAARPATAKAAR